MYATLRIDGWNIAMTVGTGRSWVGDGQLGIPKLVGDRENRTRTGNMPVGAWTSTKQDAIGTTGMANMVPNARCASSLPRSSVISLPSR